MARTRTGRTVVPGALGGMLFGVGLTVSLVVPGGGTISDDAIRSYYASETNHAAAYALYAFLVAGTFLLAWFFSEWRSRLPDSAAARTGYLLAIIGLGGTVIGAGIMLGPAGVQLNSPGSKFVGEQVAHSLAQSGLTVMIFVGFYALGLALLLLNVASRRTGLLPGWLTGAGIVISVLLIASFFVVPALLAPLWIIAAGIVGFRTAAGEAETAAG